MVVDGKEEKAEKFEEALQILRHIDKYGFGYGSGIPLPIQEQLLRVNLVYLTGLELLKEKLDNLSSVPTKKEQP